MRWAIDLLRLSHGSKQDGISGERKKFLFLFCFYFYMYMFLFIYCCWGLTSTETTYDLSGAGKRGIGGWVAHRGMSSSSHALRPGETVKTDCRHQNNIIIVRWPGHRKCNKQLVDFTACFFNSCGEHRHNRMSPFIAMLLKWFNDFEKGRQSLEHINTGLAVLHIYGKYLHRSLLRPQNLNSWMVCWSVEQNET